MALAEPLTYLYINASEGNASGGHTALRFGTETFHFQHINGGMIRLIKHASADFDHQYRYIENRTLYTTSIDLSSPHYKQLRNYFNLHFLIQKQQDATLHEIKRNIALLKRQTQSPLLTLPAAGLFATQIVSRETIPPIHKILHTKIRQKYGSDFIHKQIQHIKTQLAADRPTPWPQNALHINENAFVGAPYSFAGRYLDNISKLLFLQTLQTNKPLNNQFTFSPEQALFTLSATETRQLQNLRQTLINGLLRLLSSSRPDWGRSAFVLYARILSLTQSIQSGKLVFLDSYISNAQSIPYTEVARYRPLFYQQMQQALTRLRQHKQQLFASPAALSEQTYSQLEMLANYYYERERALNKQQGLRTTGERRLPSKAITLPQHLLPQLSHQQTNIALKHFKAYQTHLQQQLQSLYQYDLITRNCVTEIFAGIRQADINIPALQTLKQLPDKHPLAFIPFRAFDNLAKNYPQDILPSFRRQQLTKMQQEENQLIVYLREFNTLSASNYKFNTQDSFFLFFTDQNLWSRPILGSINLLAATAMGIYGGLALPFDSGKTLKNSAMGILMSLPELAFFNIRKGSYPYLPHPP